MDSVKAGRPAAAARAPERRREDGGVRRSARGSFDRGPGAAGGTRPRVIFCTIDQAERDAIVPGAPQYAARAAHDPPAAALPAFSINPAATLGMPPEAVAVPAMGMPWLAPRSPELQMCPGADPSKFRPFTTTLIHGAWNGQLTFMEPMSTRAHITAKRDAADAAGRNEVIPIPTSPTYPAGAVCPNAYRIAYDAQMKEYHIALTRAAQGN